MSRNIYKHVQLEIAVGYDRFLRLFFLSVENVETGSHIFSHDQPYLSETIEDIVVKAADVGLPEIPDIEKQLEADIAAEIALGTSQPVQYWGEVSEMTIGPL